LGERQSYKGYREHGGLYGHNTLGGLKEAGFKALKSYLGSCTVRRKQEAQLSPQRPLWGGYLTTGGNTSGDQSSGCTTRVQLGDTNGGCQTPSPARGNLDKREEPDSRGGVQ